MGVARDLSLVPPSQAKEVTIHAHVAARMLGGSRQLRTQAWAPALESTPQRPKPGAIDSEKMRAQASLKGPSPFLWGLT